jgi:hypothetical protein
MNSDWNKRFLGANGSNNFFGCIDPDGKWMDSSLSFSQAIIWCRYDSGNTKPMTAKQDVEWFNTTGVELGYSIVHGSLLEKLVKAGLVT